MGKGSGNRVLRRTAAKVKYIIRAKTNNISSKIIVLEMKVSIRTVNRVWGYWMKNKKPLAPKKFGRPNKSLGESDYSTNFGNPQRAEFWRTAHREDNRTKIWQTYAA